MSIVGLKQIIFKNNLFLLVKKSQVLSVSIWSYKESKGQLVPAEIINFKG